MTKINTIIEMMAKAQELTEFCTANNINSNVIEHVKALDPEFSTVIDSLTAIFGSSTNINTEEKEEVSDEEPLSIAIETPVETTPVEEAPTEEPTEIWKKTSTEVEISSLGNVRYGNDTIVPKMVGGYSMYYDPELKRYVALAKAVLTAFRGEMTNSYCPIYKDNDKSHCSLENLMWGMRNPTLSTDQVERACKLIVENRCLPEGELVNMLVKNHTIRSYGAYHSIMKGEYRTISDRYFIIRNGSIIPVSTASTVAPEPATVPAPTPVNVDAVRAGYISKMMSKALTEKDNAEFVLTYVMQGYESSEEILKAIHKDYGRKVMISGEFVRKLIRK